jgi:hypothetical protein
MAAAAKPPTSRRGVRVQTCKECGQAADSAGYCSCVGGSSPTARPAPEPAAPTTPRPRRAKATPAAAPTTAKAYAKARRANGPAPTTPLAAKAR